MLLLLLTHLLALHLTDCCSRDHDRPAIRTDILVLRTQHTHTQRAGAVVLQKTQLPSLLHRHLAYRHPLLVWHICTHIEPVVDLVSQAEHHTPRHQPFEVAPADDIQPHIGGHLVGKGPDGRVWTIDRRGRDMSYADVDSAEHIWSHPGEAGSSHEYVLLA